MHPQLAGPSPFCVLALKNMEHALLPFHWSPKVQTSSVFKSRHLERERLSAPWLPEMSVRNWRLDAFPAGWAL